MNAFMNVIITVRSAAALARMRAFQAAGVQAAASMNSVNRHAQWGLPYLTKWGSQIQWAGRQLIYNFTIPITLAMGAATKFALENEKAMVRVRKVYGDATPAFRKLAQKELPALEEAFTALSNKFAVHRADVIAIAGDWAAAGASGLALAKSVGLTLETMVLGELDAVDATKQLIAIQAQYGFGVEQLSKSIDILNMVENQTGATMKDLMEGMSRSAGVARVAGIDVEHLGAMMAALVPAAGTASRAGNALKTIISRILSPTREANELLAAMGVEINAVGWQSLNGGQRLEALARRFQDLSDAQKAQLATIMGSRWQLNRLVILMEAVNNKNSYYHKALRSVNDEQKIFNQRQYELQQVLESNPHKMQQAWTIIKNAMADVIVPMLPFIVFLAQKVAELAQKFADLGLTTQKWILAGLVLLALLGPIARYLGALSVMLGLLRGAFGFVIPVIHLFITKMSKPFVMAAYYGWVALGSLNKAFWTLVYTAKLVVPQVAGWLWAGARLWTLPITFAAAAIVRTWTAAMVILGPIAAQAMKALGLVWSMGGTVILPLVSALGTSIAVIWRYFMLALPTLTWAALKTIMVMFLAATRLLVNPWVLVGLAILGTIYALRDQLATAWNAIVRNAVDAWAGVVDFFYRVVDAIVKAFWSLPKGVRDAMLAVLTLVRDVALQIYEWMSYLNPFARHSPSLVESVTAGMDEIQRQYSRAVGMGAIFRKAARDLANFKREANRKKGGEYADERQDVKQSKGNLGLFDSLVNDMRALQSYLAMQEQAVKRQEAVVDRWSDALDRVNAKLDSQQARLDRLRDNLDRLNEAYQRHEDRLNSFAAAPIRGMTAMEDQIFRNELAQKKLRLEILKLNKTGTSVDDLKSRLAGLQGAIEMLRGRAASLRAAGAGTDVLGPIYAEISKLEKQREAIRDSANSGTSEVDRLQKQLDALQRKGEMLSLERDIQFDPLTHQIEKLTNAQKELSFDKIVQGIRAEQAAMAALVPKINAANKAVRDQEGAIRRTSAVRDQVQAKYDVEKKKLDELQDAYRRTEDVIRDVEAALRDMGSASRDAIQKARAKAGGGASEFVPVAVENFNAAASGNWPDVGSRQKIGREGGMKDQSAAIRRFADRAMKDMTDIMGDVDMFAPIKDMWNQAVQWLIDHTPQGLKDFVAGIRTNLKSTLAGAGIGGLLGAFVGGPWGAAIGAALGGVLANILPEGTGKKVQEFFGKIGAVIKRLIKPLKRLWALFKPDFGRIGAAFSDFGRDIWNKLGPELEKFKDLWEPLKELWSALAPILSTIAKVLGGTLLGAIKLAFSALSGLLGPVLDTIVGIIRAVIKVIRGLAEFLLGVFTLDWKLAWQGIQDIVSGAWDFIYEIIKAPIAWIIGLVKGLVNGIVELWQWLYDELVGHSIIPDMIEAIKNAFKGLVSIIKWIWNNVLKPIGRVFKWLWTKLVWPVLKTWWSLITGTWKVLFKVAKWVWNHILKPIFFVFRELWTKLVKPALKLWWEGIKGVWRVLFKVAGWVWVNVLRPVFAKVKSLWSDYVKPAFKGWWEGIKKVWSSLTKLGSWVWNNVMKPVYDKIREGWNKVKSWLKDNKDMLLGPVKGVVNVVIAAINTLIRGLNKVARILPGIEWHIDPIPRLAAGGIPTRRVNGGFKTSGARAIVGEGKPNWPEYVIPTDPTYRNRARALLEQAGSRIGMAGIPMHAEGGILGKIGKAFGAVKDWGSDAFKWIGEKARNAASFLFKPFKSLAMKALDGIDWKWGRKVGKAVLNQVDAVIKGVDTVFEKKVNSYTVVGKGGPPPQAGDYDRVSWRGHQFNARTVRMILAAERLLGQQYHITQGSFSTRVAASGSTHAGGGAFDSTFPNTIAAVNAARRVGFAAWLRSPNQGPWPYHIHAIALGDRQASASAKAQMQSYLAGGIGLWQGGIVKARQGGYHAILAERGRDEAVIPLPRNWRTTASPVKSEGGSTININGNLEFPNIKSGDDAKKLIDNLETLARG